MSDENVKYEEPIDAIDQYEEVESDRISIFQWVLMFAALGALIYFSPMLFKLLPK